MRYILPVQAFKRTIISRWRKLLGMKIFRRTLSLVSSCFTLTDRSYKEVTNRRSNKETIHAWLVNFTWQRDTGASANGRHVAPHIKQMWPRRGTPFSPISSSKLSYFITQRHSLRLPFQHPIAPVSAPISASNPTSFSVPKLTHVSAHFSPQTDPF